MKWKKVSRKWTWIVLVLIVLLIISFTPKLFQEQINPPSIEESANEICGGARTRVYQCSPTIYHIVCIGLDLPEAYIDIKSGITCKRTWGVWEECPLDISNLDCDMLVYEK